MTRSERLKLVRILGMLGSDHAGERAAAALAAHRLVQRWGGTWWSLLEPPLPSQPIVVRARWVDPFTDYLRAAQSRLRQAETENARLVRENRRLRQRAMARSGGAVR
jgi:hypothetical protein